MDGLINLELILANNDSNNIEDCKLTDTDFDNWITDTDTDTDFYSEKLHKLGCDN